MSGFCNGHSPSETVPGCKYCNMTWDDAEAILIERSNKYDKCGVRLGPKIQKDLPISSDFLDALRNNGAREELVIALEKRNEKILNKKTEHQINLEKEYERGKQDGIRQCIKECKERVTILLEINSFTWCKESFTRGIELSDFLQKLKDLLK